MAIRRPEFPASENPACKHNCMYTSHMKLKVYTIQCTSGSAPIVWYTTIAISTLHYLQCLFNIIEDINWSYSFFFFPINWSLIWESCTYTVHDVQNKNKHLYHVHPVFMVVASYNKFCFFFEVSQFYSSAHVQTSSRAN